MKKRFLAIILSVLLIFTGFSTSCTQDSGGNDAETIVLLLLLLQAYNGPGPNTTYLSRANTALDTWGIGLVQNITASNRSLGGDTAFDSPANWITVSDDSCSTRGIPTRLTGSSCPLTGGVIGVCSTRYYTSGSTGQIVDTTLILLDSYQTNTSVTDSNKQSVFTHEVGHCLGLDHSASTSDIMFSDTSGADTPSAGELSDIASAYSPTVQAPADASRFSQESSVAIRHHTFPEFTISYNIGNAFTDESTKEEVPAPGELLLFETETRTHLYYEDGHVETIIHKEK